MGASRPPRVPAMLGLNEEGIISKSVDGGALKKVLCEVFTEF